MKKSHLLFLLPAFIIACNNAPKEEQVNDPNLLPASIVNNPRTAEGTDTNALASLATMDFKDTVFNFGTITEGEVVKKEFEFTNNGKGPLIISNASASCGCTVADFPREPLEPGKSASIKVEFHSTGKSGHQEKAVTIVTNAVRGNYFLYLKGEVKAKK